MTSQKFNRATLTIDGASFDLASVTCIHTDGQCITRRQGASTSVTMRVLSRDRVEVAVSDGVAMVAETVPGDMIRMIHRRLEQGK